MAVALTKNRLRAEKFKRLSKDIHTITTNDPYYRDSLTPNPWRVLPSSDDCEPWARQLGMYTQQIDTRPGLCRKDKVNE